MKSIMTGECIYCTGGETAREWPEGPTGVLLRALAIETHELECSYAESLRMEIHDELEACGHSPEKMIEQVIELTRQVHYA